MSLTTNHSLAEWLSWLETLHPREIDLSLSRIRGVAQTLGLFDFEGTVITVGGTNGKGSCVAMVEAMLVDNHQPVGTYTSPHIIAFNERIKINGTPVGDQDIIDAFYLINSARKKTSLTYFEFGTLAALILFKKYRVDYYVLEVGLGGRLDAVNILDADLAIITSIDLDHTEWLGETRELIAAEKSGILRPNQKVVCTEPSPPQSLLDAFEKNGVTLHQIGQDFTCAELPNGLLDVEFIVRQAFQRRYSVPQPQLPLSSVLAATQALLALGFDLSGESIKRLWHSVELEGRFNRHVYRECKFILDVAHNPAATQYLIKRLQKSQALPCKVVVACMKDKNIRDILSPLANVAERWYLAEISELPRSASVKMLSVELKQLDRDIGLNRSTICECGSVEEAIDLAVDDNSNEKFPILVFGSFYTISAALKHIKA